MCVRCAMCDVRAMCGARCAMCYVLCAMCDVRRAMCVRAMCDVRRATCDVRRATCDVQSPLVLFITLSYLKQNMKTVKYDDVHYSHSYSHSDDSHSESARVCTTRREPARVCSSVCGC